MNQFVNFNNMSNFGIGYTDNLYNQSSFIPSLPSLSECLNNSYNYNFGSSYGVNPYASMMPSISSYSQPIANNNLQELLNLVTMMKNPDMSEYQTQAQMDPELLNTSDENFSYEAGALKAKWAKYNLSDRFYSKVINISKRLKCDPNALMAVMKSESGLNSKAKNPNSSATGLIQFMDSTAKGLGTTTAELKRMSPEKQLDYVEKYLVKMKNMAGISETKTMNGATLYSLVFLPAYAGRDVLCRKGSTYYEANKGLDLNKDGDIDKMDLNRRVNNLMA